MTKIVTKEQIIETLANKDREFLQHYIGRALKALLKQQTDSEAQDAQTKNLNFRGFAPCDARDGTLSAKYYIKHSKLEDWQIDRWVKTHGNAPRIAKYHRQLNEAALARRAA